MHPTSIPRLRRRSLDLSGPQSNNTGSRENRIARILYTDSINAPITLDIPYAIDDSSCGVQSLIFDFDVDNEDWLKGTSYGPAPLPNDDISAPDGWGHFSYGCTVPGTETSSGGAISGGYWMTGDDHDDTTCENAGNYGNQAEYNLLSPFITVPALCAAGSLQLVFDTVITAAPTADVNLYISTDNGLSWGFPGLDH